MQPETYGIMRDIEETHWWFKGRRNIIDQMVSTLPIPNHANILEIGCGTGGNLATLAKYGAVTGIEMNESALAFARSRRVAPVDQGSLPDNLPPINKSLDLVALFDVIEHIDDDLSALQTCKELLSGNGHILLTVPAFMSLWSQHDVDNEHKRRYRRQDINKLAGDCDLEIVFFSYFNFWLFPPTALAKLSRQLVPYKQTWGDMKPPPKLINNVLYSIFSSEGKIIGKRPLPFGTSIIAALSKRRPD